MKILLSVIPIAILVAYSQLMVKWRATTMGSTFPEDSGFVAKVLHFLSDPLLVSAYVAALLASFLWLFVVARLPLAVAFPVYIGVTFVFVIFGGWVFLSEAVTVTRLLATGLILAGIALGVRS